MIDGKPAVRGGRRWAALRLGIVALWLFGAGIAWWTAPRQHDYEAATTDLASGRVVAYQWGDRWDANQRRPWFGTSDLESSGALGPFFAWRTPDGRIRWTDTTNFDQVTLTGAIDRSAYAGPGAVGLAQQVQAAGLEGRSGVLQPLGQVVGGTGLAAAAITFGVLLAGPAPVLGTRWFWFWLVCLVPFGLGILAWLAREHPWAPSASPRTGPGGRDSGVLGVAVGVAATILGSILSLMLGQLLGDWWVPRLNAE
ncbi:hypothetical protein HCA58_03005 [Micromonospora sp. HNM0581]|uniref:hypothetical protein n=1 Tax=Micromonospora sp. HNM0581 TaxID=2716341 RepID=UPI00146C8785|nr:hypothetical protein [Micromonospora sp. HNM0581]NLU77375.1 hypothetical protein [Micromonospora sp. HNM0581]